MTGRTPGWRVAAETGVSRTADAASGFDDLHTGIGGLRPIDRVDNVPSQYTERRTR
ncbi:hypothetical protein GCM10009718_18120 [Isoptericola halotolerans]